MKLHKKSERVIKETFALYTQGEKCPAVLKGKTILHLYPAEDTMDSDGSLNGYYQNLFFDLVVFNDYNGKRIRYDLGKRDAIFTEANIKNLTVFKDGAFCVLLDGSHQFLDGQAVFITKI
jgi:hypothetical protein